MESNLKDAHASTPEKALNNRQETPNIGSNDSFSLDRSPRIVEKAFAAFWIVMALAAAGWLWLALFAL